MKDLSLAQLDVGNVFAIKIKVIAADLSNVCTL